jgi:hypothetical protein
MWILLAFGTFQNLQELGPIFLTIVVVSWLHPKFGIHENFIVMARVALCFVTCPKSSLMSILCKSFGLVHNTDGFLQKW